MNHAPRLIGYGMMIRVEGLVSMEKLQMEGKDSLIKSGLNTTRKGKGFIFR